MRGIIFTTFNKFVESNFGYEVLDEILLSEEFPNKGGFSSGGNYDTKYLFLLIEKSKFYFNNDLKKTHYEFGKFAFKSLILQFRALYSGHESAILHIKNAYDFLENLNMLHFQELQKLYPKAEFPKFKINRKSQNSIILEYKSPINAPYLVKGLIQGCLDFYSDDSKILMKKKNNNEFNFEFIVSKK